MSFSFPDWSTAFSPAFHDDAKAMLEGALNKGNKPPVIQGHIEVVELSMGTQPPTLTLLEIGDLSLDRFRGILRLGYQGDAWIEVRCRVQANPLSHNPNLLPSSTLPMSTPLAASQPLLVPMTLRLSKLHLRAILILVVSKAKGITLVFKNDPLQNVDVSSTFDSIEVIRGYLQQEIEGQLREMFREDLPGIIHRLSQKWFSGSGVGAGGRVELPYKDPEYISPAIPPTPGREEEDEDDVFSQKPIFPPRVQSVSPNVTPRRRVSQVKPRERRASVAASESPTSYTTFPEIEDYDPSYGLRPEGVPAHSGYEAFGRLWEKARQGEGRGLGALMSQPEEEGEASDLEKDEDEVRSLDMVEMEESLRAVGKKLSRSVSARSGMSMASEEEVEWETFPAVGGGVITRPRVYHAQSKIRAPSEAGGAMPSPSGTATQGSVTARASSIGGASSTLGSLRRHPTLPSMPSAMTAIRPPIPGPGPSSLRRMVTSRSDVFLAGHQASRSESIARSQMPPLSRRLSGAGSSAAHTARSSWHESGPTRSTSLSTKGTSQYASSRPVSIQNANPKISPSKSRAGTGTSPGKSFPPRTMGPGGITLPLNNSVSQLATLSNSAHTLSPYARGHEHIAVRSFPHLGKTNPSVGSSSSASLVGVNGDLAHGPIKARRKRIFHLKKETDTKNLAADPPLSPDVDDRVVTPDEMYSNQSPSNAGRSRSSSAEYPILTRSFPAQRPLSLVGAATRMMGDSASRSPSRPNYGRAPASRTSYGFPPTGGFD